MIFLCTQNDGYTSHVTSHTSILNSLLHNVIYEGGSGSLAVTACDADALTLAITLCKLKLAEDRCSLLYEFLNHRSCIRNARALYNFCS